MPSSITHELIARESEELLPAGAKNAISCAPDYYFLGAQGPDLFFFYRPLLSRKHNFGRFLHTQKVYEWFSALMNLLPAEGRARECCLAYALGFCSHLAADTVFHPFVYNFLRENGNPRYRHQRIENDWDVYFLRALTGRTPYGYAYSFHGKEIVREKILFPYLQACAKAVGKELSPRPFRRMMRLFWLYLTHFHKKRRPLSTFGLGDLYPRERPDPAVLGGERFSALSLGKGGDADKLFLAATRESATCISAFFDAAMSNAPLPKTLFSRNLLTGETNISNDFFSAQRNRSSE